MATLSLEASDEERKQARNDYQGVNTFNPEPPVKEEPRHKGAVSMLQRKIALLERKLARNRERVADTSETSEGYVNGGISDNYNGSSMTGVDNTAGKLSSQPSAGQCMEEPPTREVSKPQSDVRSQTLPLVTVSQDPETIESKPEATLELKDLPLQTLDPLTNELSDTAREALEERETVDGEQAFGEYE